VVTDSGGAHDRPVESEAKWNVGLTNTRERLQVLYGDAQSLHAASDRGGAFRVQVSLPARRLLQPVA
jgi:sensor histidine kinase YesM